MAVGSNLKVVSIDDDRIQHILVKKRMQMVDPTIETISFDEPQNALEWLAENKAHLILMDLNFPELSGWELLLEIQKITETPLVILTGNISPFELQKKEEYPQVIRLLEKPISASHIEEIISQIVT
ncbi:response regulator [Algoriphagus machipongonensis]|uniref:Response regulator receiver domain protein n=1 Tax=Algoriphagus machipongonensis TaxID=388413 RepID=A3I1C5_9BACT|nr:response regulator [Algoriphagus machipongonensis]EAZ79591.1 putative response regulator receiver domain protein [Algoriphagus machipongonensis]